MLDGSAILNFLTGRSPLLDAADVALVPGARSEFSGFVGEDTVFTADANGVPGTPIIGQLNYDQTLQGLSWLASLGDDLDAAIPTFREKLAEFALDNPQFESVERLLSFSQDTSLNRKGGTIRVPWFNPFELSNDFVGWRFVTGGVPSDQEPLWPRPELAKGVEEPVASYLLTRDVVLFSGQRLVGDLATIGLGFRDRFISTLRRDAGKTFFSLMARVAPPGLHPADGKPLPQHCFPQPEADTPPEIEVEDGELVPGFGARGWAVVRGAVQNEPLRGIELRELHIVLDMAHGRDPDHHLQCMLDLDGITDCRVEHVALLSVRRGSVCVESANCGRILNANLIAHVIRLGKHRPTEGVLLKDCLIKAEPYRAYVLFGPKARQNLWIGGEVGNVESEVVVEGVSGLHWAAGSKGNWVRGGDIEPRIPFGRSRFLMEGQGGAIESIRVEPLRNQCLPQRLGRIGACVAAAGDLFDVLDVRQEPYSDVEITRTGRDNSVYWMQFIPSRVLDHGVGTFVRGWDANFADNASAMLTPQTWDNLLENGHLAFVPGSQVARGWSIEGGRPTTLLHLSGRPGALIEADAAGQITLSQTVSVWGTPSPDGLPTDDYANARDRDGVRSCVTVRRTSGRASFEGEREYLATVQVHSADRAAVTLRLSAMGPAGLRLTQFQRVDFEPGQEGQVHVGLRTPPGTTSLRWHLSYRGRRLVVAGASLVEGSQQPSDRLRPIGPAGDAMHGPLWLPGATALVPLLPGLPWVAPARSRVIALYGHGVAFDVAAQGLLVTLVHAHDGSDRALGVVDLRPDERPPIVQGTLFGSESRAAHVLERGDLVIAHLDRAAADPPDWRVTLAVTQAV